MLLGERLDRARRAAGGRRRARRRRTRRRCACPCRGSGPRTDRAPPRSAAPRRSATAIPGSRHASLNATRRSSSMSRASNTMPVSVRAISSRIAYVDATTSPGLERTRRAVAESRGCRERPGRHHRVISCVAQNSTSPATAGRRPCATRPRRRDRRAGRRAACRVLATRSIERRGARRRGTM